MSHGSEPDTVHDQLREPLLAAGATSSLTLSALQVAPAPYYYGPTVAALGLAAVLVAVAPASSADRGGQLVVVAAVALTLTANLALDIGRGVPSSDGSPPIRVNWATNAEYRALTDAIPDGAVVESPGEIGALAFYCADRCTVVDFLSTRAGWRPCSSSGAPNTTGC